jgi:alpha-ketoglutarate-dependent 2,4-dichlorophenoxyacetate dioxygenase
LSLSIIPFEHAFGAEISGVDITKPIDDAVYGAIRTAFEEHSVLVFRDQPFDDESQIEFSQRFGPVEIVTKTRVGGGGGTLIADISNVDRDSDDIMPVDGDVMTYRSGNEMWHTDSSFRRVPAMASMLSGREVPPVGGQTEFASLRVAYSRLEADKQTELEDLVAVHDYTYSRGLEGSLLSKAQQNELPPVQQKVVRTNPANGKKNYFTASQASHIVGWPIEQRRAYMKDLVARATRPEDIYSHEWGQKIWSPRITGARCIVAARGKNPAIAGLCAAPR